jgi:hypothetical protein
MGRGDSRRPSYGVEGVNPRYLRAVVAGAIQPAGRNREGLLLKDRIIVLGGCNENQQETIMQKR